VNTIPIKSAFLLSAWAVTSCAQAEVPGDETPMEEQLEEPPVAAGGQEGMGDPTLPPPSTGGLTQQETFGGGTTNMAGEGSVVANGGSAEGTPPAGDGGSHPLFGEGSTGGVDPDDPCLNSQFWRVEAAIELTTGTLIIHDGQLWELTGEASGNWGLEDCTPPGTGWCEEQYAWVVVGTCPEE
jgi:hypothetical protein